MTSCSLLENKENKAIETVKISKIQFDTDNIFGNMLFGMSGLGQGSTWQDFANMIAKQDPNNKYSWSAKSTDELGIYVVAFADEKGWGHRWEVNLEQQIVNHINQNEYLCRKYGLSRFDSDNSFEILNIKIDTLKIEKEYDYYSGGNTKSVVYILKADIKNKTGKSLSDAEIKGKLKVIFKDKTVEGSSDWDSGFKTNISKSKPWNPDTEKSFYLKTKGIEEIYLNYLPEYVFFEVGLKAEDPIGYSYDKDVAEFDLKDKWKNLMK